MVFLLQPAPPRSELQPALLGELSRLQSAGAIATNPMLNGCSFDAGSFAPAFSIRQMYLVYRLRCTGN
jgi:hypothetical protein